MFKGLTIVIMAFFVIEAGAQEANQSRYAVSASFGRQKVGIPFLKILDFPSHSSFSLEVSRKYGSPHTKSWYQSAGIIGFQNTSLGSGYLIQSNVGKGFPLSKTLGIFPEIGLSITHRFLPKENFVLVDGHYQSGKDFGSIKSGVNLRCLLGYTTQSILLFVSYQLSAELFYNDDLPFIPVNYLQLGIRYNLKSSEK
jgi:hypothetical protein